MPSIDVEGSMEVCEHPPRENGHKSHDSTPAIMNGHNSSIKNSPSISNDFEEKKPVEVTDPEFSCILPASANWYCTSIASCLNGKCAFGGKNVVYLVDLLKPVPVVNNFIPGSGNMSKITAVHLSLSSTSTLNCVFAQEDGLVRIVDVDTKATVKEHHRHRVKVTCLSWSDRCKQQVVSGDEKGVIAIWKYEDSSLVLWTPVISQLNSIKISPFKENMAILGYSNGNVVLADLATTEMMQNYKSHTDDVTALCWCPVVEGDGCFLSASKDGTLRIWDCSQEKPTSTFYQPKNTRRGKKEKFDISKAKTWQGALWINSTNIIATHSSGALVLWNTETSSSEFLQQAHQRTVFMLAHCDQAKKFISIGMDRQLTIWDSLDMHVQATVPTFGGFVYSLSCVALNPHAVVISCGDQMVRSWNTSDPAEPFRCAALSQNIKSKCTIIQLHPNREGIAAFGTDDGHVGVYNFLTQKSELSITYHHKTVYSLSWGPVCRAVGEEAPEDDNRINCIYSVGGEGSMFAHRLGSFNRDAINITVLIKKTNDLKLAPARSEVAWKPDRRFVATGNEDGSIEVFSAPHLRLVCTLTLHKRCVNALSWHHDYSDTQAAEHAWWIASGSNESVVNVTSLVALANHDTDAAPLKFTTALHQLTGHTGRITGLAWSPHTTARLASASYDHSVQIWDVDKSTPVANFRDHTGRVMCVEWSFNDANVLYSGSEDFTVRRWKVSEQTERIPPSNTKKPKTKSKQTTNVETHQKTNNANNLIEQPVKTEVISQEARSSLEKPDNALISTPSTIAEEKLPTIATSVETQATNQLASIDGDSDMNIHIVGKYDRKAGKKKKMRSLLPLSAVANRPSKEVSQDDCLRLATHLVGKAAECPNGGTVCAESTITPGVGEHVHFGLFSTRTDVFKLLATEGCSHTENGHADLALQLAVWEGRLGEMIDRAVEEGAVTENMVAMSPLAGHDVWRACVLAYAEQLESRKAIHAAVMYYLTAGETLRAISAFRTNLLFKEATVLARARLASSDPLVAELYVAWADNLAEKHEPEPAAKCYLAAGMPEHAVALLTKRSTAQAYLTAVGISEVYSLKDDKDAMLQTCMKLLLREMRWSSFHELASRRLSERVDISHLLAVVGEGITEILKRHEPYASSQLIDNHNSHQHFTSTWAREYDPSFCFYDAILKVWSEKFSLKKESIDTFTHINLESLKLNSDGRTTLVEKEELFEDITKLITLGLLELLHDRPVAALTSWLSVFEAVYESGHRSLLVALYECLFPRGTVGEQFGDVDANAAANSSENFEAFKCIGQLYKTWWGLAVVKLSTKTMENDTMSSMSVENSNFLKDQDPVAGLTNTAAIQSENSLLALITSGKDLLLNSAKVELTRCQQLMKRLKSHSMEANIKRRLRQRIKENEVQSSDVTSTHDSEKREETSLVYIKQSISDDVSKQSTTDVDELPYELRDSIGRVVNLDGSGQSDQHVQMMLQEKINATPTNILELPFPAIEESVHVLARISQLVPVVDVLSGRDSSSHLIDDIISWTSEHAPGMCEGPAGKLLRRRAVIHIDPAATEE